MSSRFSSRNLELRIELSVTEGSQVIFCLKNNFDKIKSLTFHIFYLIQTNSLIFVLFLLFHFGYYTLQLTLYFGMSNLRGKNKSELAMILTGLEDTDMQLRQMDEAGQMGIYLENLN